MEKRVCENTGFVETTATCTEHPVCANMFYFTTLLGIFIPISQKREPRLGEMPGCSPRKTVTPLCDTPSHLCDAEDKTSQSVLRY